MGGEREGDSTLSSLRKKEAPSLIQNFPNTTFGSDSCWLVYSSEADYSSLCNFRPLSSSQTTSFFCLPAIYSSSPSNYRSIRRSPRSSSFVLLLSFYLASSDSSDTHRTLETEGGVGQVGLGAVQGRLDELVQTSLSSSSSWVSLPSSFFRLSLPEGAQLN